VTASKLTYQQIRATARLYNTHKGNLSAMDVATGIARPTLQHRVREGKKRHPKLFKDFPSARGGSPAAVEKPVATLDENVRVHRAEQKAKESDGRLKDAIKQLALVEDRLRDLEWANNVSFKPADWTFMERTNRKRSTCRSCLPRTSRLAK
jgi:hypothetical protein